MNEQNKQSTELTEVSNSQEFKVCRNCGRSLPSTSFRLTRWGKRVEVCNDCIISKRKPKAKRDIYIAHRRKAERALPRIRCCVLLRRANLSTNFGRAVMKARFVTCRK